MRVTTRRASDVVESASASTSDHFLLEFSAQTPRSNFGFGFGARNMSTTDPGARALLRLCLTLRSRMAEYRRLLRQKQLAISTRGLQHWQDLRRTSCRHARWLASMSCVLETSTGITVRPRCPWVSINSRFSLHVLRQTSDSKQAFGESTDTVHWTQPKDGSKRSESERDREGERTNILSWTDDRCGPWGPDLRSLRKQAGGQ